MASVGELHALRARERPRRSVGATVLLAVRRLLGLASIVGLSICSWAIVTGAAYRPTALVPARTGGFPPWLRGPLQGAGGYLPYSDFAVWMVVMVGIFLAALLTVPALHVRWVIAATVLLQVLFFLGPPLISADIMGYIDWARAGVLHGLNPYSTNSGTVVSDAVYPFVRWDNFTSPYGPLFTLFSYALVPLGLALNLWALKFAALLASLGITWLIYACARERDLDPRLGLVLYGLNPAVLVYAVGGAHNDLLMTLMLLLGVYLLLRGRERAAAVSGSLAVAVKASAGLAVPFLILGAKERGRALKAAVVTGAAVLGVALVTFGGRAFDFVNVLRTQQGLDSGTSVMAELGRLLGWDGNPAGARFVAGLLFLGVLAAMLWRTWRRREAWLDSAAWSTFALLVCTSWLLAWYIVWLVPLAALGRSRWLPTAAAALTVFVVLARVVPFL
jgi:alpha-1,6-mannosyltransferase